MIDLDMKILLVDDSRVIRAILLKMLNKVGFTNIHEAKNGTAGLKKLREEGGFDFVISDWMMPGMNGLDFLKAIRADEELKDTFVMMVSAESIDERIEVAMEAGADSYITKPFTPEKIKAGIMKIFFKTKK